MDVQAYAMAENDHKDCFLRFVVGGNGHAKLVIGLSPEARRLLNEFDGPEDFSFELATASAAAIRKFWDKMKQKE